MENEFGVDDIILVKSVFGDCLINCGNEIDAINIFESAK
jgi:hypothetical protein